MKKPEPPKIRYSNDFEKNTGFFDFSLKYRIKNHEDGFIVQERTFIFFWSMYKEVGDKEMTPKIFKTKKQARDFVKTRKEYDSKKKPERFIEYL